MWNLAENIPVQRKDGHKEMKGEGQQDVHVPSPVCSSQGKAAPAVPGSSTTGSIRMSHTSARFAFSFLAAEMGKQHSRLSRAKIFLCSQKKKKKEKKSEFVSVWMCGESS